MGIWYDRVCGYVYTSLGTLTDSIKTLLIGKVPYYDLSSDVSVILAIVRGKLLAWSKYSETQPSFSKPLRRLRRFCWVDLPIKESINTMTAELHHLEAFLRRDHPHCKEYDRKYKFRFLRETEFPGAAEEQVAKQDKARACSDLQQDNRVRSRFFGRISKGDGNA